MSALPAEKTDPLEDAPYLACRHFLFEKGSFHEGGIQVPEGAGLCESPIGPIDALDCPLWVGRTCRFFEERTEDPVALDAEALAEARDGLREQYLRWRYRERVRRLAEDAVDPVLIDVTELDPAEDARREKERHRNEAKAKEQGKKKRRRRRRKKKSPDAAAGAPGGSGGAAPAESVVASESSSSPEPAAPETASETSPEATPAPNPSAPPEPAADAPARDAAPDAPGE